jgi:chromosome segregation ATPase
MSYLKVLMAMPFITLITLQSSAEVKSRVDDIIVESEEAEGGVDAALEEKNIAISNREADLRHHASERRSAQLKVERAKQEIARSRDLQLKAEADSAKYKKEIKQFQKDQQAAESQASQATAKMEKSRAQAATLAEQRIRAETQTREAKEKLALILQKDAQERQRLAQIQKEYTLSLRQKDQAQRELELRSRKYADAQRERKMRSKQVIAQRDRLTRETSDLQNKSKQLEQKTQVYRSETLVAYHPNRQQRVVTQVKSTTPAAASTKAPIKPNPSFLARIKNLWSK